MSLRATIRPLEVDVDLNDIAGGVGVLFVRDGVGVAGRGVAARVTAPDIAELLESIDIAGDRYEGAPSPRALGIIPFVPGRPSDFVLPAVCVVKQPDGSGWVISVEGGDEHAPSLEPFPRPTPRAQAFSVSPLTPVNRYLTAVGTARQAVIDGRLTKAVIAREITVSSDEPIDVHAVLLRLRASFGSSYRFSIDGFIGASPELLLSVHGTAVQSHPLAGTAPRSGDPDTDARVATELLASPKNQIEHRVVIDMIHETLLPWCSYLDWEPEPKILTVANVQHLRTVMEGRLSEPRPNVLELVRVLAPTPALGGYPREPALELIARAEGFERGPYGGAVGWVDTRGDGTWAVAIRCAELSLDRRSARLVAGGGIVAASDPAEELAETQAKFQAMLSAIVRP